MIDSICLLDLPPMVYPKIVSLLDPHSIVYLSQTCKNLREYVKLDYLTELTLPNDGFSVEEHNGRKLKVLKLKLNIDACGKPIRVNRWATFYESTYESMLPIMQHFNFDDTVEISIILNYAFTSFPAELSEDFSTLQEMFKEMKSLNKFKISVNCKVVNSVLANIQFKQIIDLLLLTCATEVIIKLPKAIKQEFVYIPKSATRVLVYRYLN